MSQFRDPHVREALYNMQKFKGEMLMSRFVATMTMILGVFGLFVTTPDVYGQITGVYG